MEKSYTKFPGLLIVGFILLFTAKAEAQTIYFQQNFSGSGPFTSKNPNSTQFDTIYVTSPTVVRLAPGQGYVEFERTVTSGGGSARMVRSTDFTPVPSTMYYQVRLNVVSTGQATPNVATFNVGQNLSPSNNALPPDANLFGKFSINFVGGGSYRFAKTGAGATTSSLYSGSVLITWVLNNLPTTLKYKNPNNSLDSVKAKSYDLWIDGSRFLEGSPALSSVQLTDISFRFQDGIGVIRLGDFLIRDVSGILPVNLTSFNAQALNDQVALSWETARERESQAFIVQRSSDLKEFGDIGRVGAAVDTEGQQKYSFMDTSPAPGVNYYRLRMVDQNGSYTYSKVKDVIVGLGKPQVVVSPNPTTGTGIRIKVVGVDVSSLRLTSLLGRPMPFRVRSTGPDTWEIIPESPLSAGMYFFHSDGFPAFGTVRFLVE